MAEAVMVKLEELGVGAWLTQGDRVIRGPDWKGGNADGLLGGSGEGTVTKAAGKAGMVSVKWDNGNYGYYRMGAGNKYELRTAIPPPPPTPPPLPSPESEYESEYDEEEEEEEEESPDPPAPARTPTPPPPQCEMCGLVLTENCLSTSVCVVCTSKLWRGETPRRKLGTPSPSPQVERKKVPVVSTPPPASKFGLKNFLATASTHMEKERMAQEKIEQPTSNKPKRSGFGPSALAVFARKS